jgi:hypothetical protein
MDVREVTVVPEAAAVTTVPEVIPEAAAVTTAVILEPPVVHLISALPI